MSLVMQLMEVAPVNFPAQRRSGITLQTDGLRKTKEGHRDNSQEKQKHLQHHKVNKASRNIKDPVTEEQHMEAAEAGVLQGPGRTPVGQRP